MAEPAVFGEYAIESMIGEGGNGTVYRARQARLDRCVALKVFPKLKSNKDLIDRFYSEAKTAARLIHPNIVQIFSVAELEGTPYFAMEYVEGIDLGTLMHNHPAPFIAEETVEVVRSVAKALSLASENGIVHRNIQPSTIMITKTGLVKVTDFGAAIVEKGSSQAGLVVGTPMYMSPEQGAGQPADIRSDIYSLGCVFYHCLCDHPPFWGDAASVLQRHASEAPEPPSKHHADLDPEIEKICLMMLAKNPADRYQNANQVLTALSAFDTGNVSEILLAKRVELVMRARNPESTRVNVKAVPDCVILPADSGTSVPPAAPAPAPRPPAKSSGAIPYVPPARSSAFVKAVAASVPGASSSSVMSIKTSGSGRYPSAFISKSSGANPAVIVDTVPSTSGAQARAILEAAKTAPLKPADVFIKLGDGRWSYQAQFGRCPFGEGLASELPPKGTDSESGLGDCLLCCNWNKRTGCAMASNIELETKNKSGQLKPIVEQAIVWIGAGRFDMAVALLDDYVKNNPMDAEGYRELARVYDRPDYNGKNRRRAVVLYRRFVELAKEFNASTPFEVTRAEVRAQALITAPEGKGPGVSTSSGIIFQCYLRGVNCYVYGTATANWLILSRLGETDPETGQGPPELGGAMEKATRVFRRTKSDRTKKIEADAAKQEIARLSELYPDALRADKTCVAAIACTQVTSTSATNLSGGDLRSVTIKDAQRSYELIFSDATVFKSEQILELLRRRMPAQK
jgi:serine/threonine protein kinase